MRTRRACFTMLALSSLAACGQSTIDPIKLGMWPTGGALNPGAGTGGAGGGGSSSAGGSSGAGIGAAGTGGGAGDLDGGADRATLSPFAEALAKSLAAWRAARDAHGSNYAYTSKTASFTGTYSQDTYIFAVGSLVAIEGERGVSVTDGGKEVAERRSQALAELPETPARTMDDVYEYCRTEVLTKDPNANQVIFSTDARGILATCGYVPNGCMDDCFLGDTVEVTFPVETARYAQSLAAWHTARDAHDNGYRYTTQTSSWTTWRELETVTVTQGIVTGVEGYTDMMVDGGRTVLERWSSKNGVLTGARTGTVASYFTVDDWYRYCFGVLQRDPAEYSPALGVDTNGILSSCTYTLSQCSDDCTQGLHIEAVPIYVAPAHPDGGEN